MNIINLVLNAPTIAIRGFFGVVTAGTAVSVVGACISVAVVVTVVMKPNLNGTTPLTSTESYLAEMNSMIGLNRFIIKSETNYYYNSTETLLIIFDELDRKLRDVFRDSYIKIVISNFSSEPQLNVPGLTRKRRFHYRRLLDWNTHTNNSKVLSRLIEPLPSANSSVIKTNISIHGSIVLNKLTNIVSRTTTTSSTKTTSNAAFDTTLPTQTTSLPIFSTQSFNSSVDVEKTESPKNTSTTTSLVLNNSSQTSDLFPGDNEPIHSITSMIDETTDDLATTDSSDSSEDENSETYVVSTGEALSTTPDTILDLSSTMISDQTISEEVQSSLSETYGTDVYELYESSAFTLIDYDSTERTTAYENTPDLSTDAPPTENIQETSSTTTTPHSHSISQITKSTTVPLTATTGSPVLSTSTTKPSVLSTVTTMESKTTKLTTKASTAYYASSSSTDEMSSSSESILTTISETTMLENTTPGKCNASASNNGNRKSIVFVYATIYFNITKNKNISAEDVYEVLKSWNSVITLADTCGQPSPAPSSFNPTLSKITEPSKTNVSVAVLQEETSIPDSVLNETIQATVPPDALQPNAITPSSTTIQTTSIVLTTATSTTHVTTAPRSTVITTPLTTINTPPTTMTPTPIIPTEFSITDPTPDLLLGGA